MWNIDDVSQHNSSCSHLLNSSIAAFLFWCSSKPSSNVRPPLQTSVLQHSLLTRSLVQFQWAKSHLLDPVSSSSIFLKHADRCILNLLLQLSFHHNSQSLHPIILDLSGLYHPSPLKFLHLPVISSPKPSPIFSMRWVIAFMPHIPCVLSSYATLSKCKFTLGISQPWLAPHIHFLCCYFHAVWTCLAWMLQWGWLLTL